MNTLNTYQKIRKNSMPMVGIKIHKEKRNYNVSEKLKSIDVNIELKPNDYEIDQLIYILMCARTKLIKGEKVLASNRLDYAKEILDEYSKTIDKEIYPNAESNKK